MPINTCALCLQEKEIVESHVIGNSIFRRIFRENSGNAILISGDAQKTRYTSDSWSSKLLCNDCEKLINENYEQHAIKVIRAQKPIEKSRSHIKISDINPKAFTLYFLSMLWRAAKSKHPSYEKIILRDGDLEYLRDCILHNKKIPLARFSISIKRIRIPNTAEDISKEIIVEPYSKKTSPSKIVTTFIFEGFFIEIFSPGLKVKDRKSPGIIRTSTIHIPYIDIYDLPSEITRLFAIAVEKQKAGHSRIK